LQDPQRLFQKADPPLPRSQLGVRSASRRLKSSSSLSSNAMRAVPSMASAGAPELLST